MYMTVTFTFCTRANMSYSRDDLTINGGGSLNVTTEYQPAIVCNDDESGYVYIESGNISIPACYEGIEAVDITIAGGKIDIMPADDGINANGRGSNSVIRITGGDISIINETGRDADGLDSNGDIFISGGNRTCIGNDSLQFFVYYLKYTGTANG